MTDFINNSDCDTDIVSVNSDGSYQHISATIDNTSGAFYKNARNNTIIEPVTSELYYGTVTTTEAITGGSVEITIAPPQSMYMNTVEKVKCTLCGKTMNHKNANKHLKQFHAEEWLEENLLNDHKGYDVED